MKIWSVLILLLIILPSAIAIADYNSTTKRLDAVRNTTEKMAAAGLPVQKPLDLLEEAASYLLAQEIIEKDNGTPDYKRITGMIDEVESLQQKTYLVSDELTALDDYLTEQEGIDLSPANDLRKEAEQKYRDERFDEALKSIDQVYERVSELNAEKTKAKAFYEATTDRITEFFRRTWKLLVIEGVALFILFILFRKAMLRGRIRARIKRLERERELLQELTKETQEHYFEKQSFSEGEYQIRIKKYGEMIRTINSEIPLLREQFALLKRQHKTT